MRRFALILVVFFSMAVQVSGQASAQDEGKMIAVSTAIDTSMDAYIVGPENANKAILLLHDRWGLNDTVRGWADRFADKGYLVLAIDVFDGRSSNEMGFATEIMNSVDPEWIKADVVAGLKHLQAHNRKVVTVGAGLGGWQSFQAALLEPDLVDATIVLYGEMTADVELARGLKAPVLGIFAKQDIKIAQLDVDAYEYALRKSLTPYRIYSLAADHGFLDPRYPTYNKSLADDAWLKVDRFLGSLAGG
ncbi:dienelactone hydrolase family protein [Pseudomonadota bacterium]